ncbi:MAG: copper chaperone PCu(A)C [Burkholderiales bacterium]|nr:copper chaperone PCu(A)C [Burkholderiales bacterium]MDE2396476.1 copper chaperone PCu(A)C [Burkholderiales bacterium]
MKSAKLFAGLLCAVAALAAQAQTRVEDAWVRATVPHQMASAFFARITSTQGGRLVAASTPVAGVAEVHQMSMAGGVMKMRAAAGGLELPAGKAVALTPGGYHLMLMDLKQTLKAGEEVPVTLVVEHADKQRETIELKVPVLAAAPGH